MKGISITTKELEFENDLKNHSKEVKNLQLRIKNRDNRIDELENNLDFANDTTDEYVTFMKKLVLSLPKRFNNRINYIKK